MTHCPLCAAKDDLIQSLEDRVASLEAAMMGEATPPMEYGLTAHEGRLLGMLITREQCTKEQLLAGIYSARADDPPEIKIVDVYVCKIRKKLKPFGIEIETLWGVGYRIAPASKARIAEALAA